MADEVMLICAADLPLPGKDGRKSYTALIKLSNRLEGKDKRTVEAALFCLSEADRRNAKLVAENQRLRKALRIFADTAEIFTDDAPNNYPVKEYLRHFRTAAAVLKEVGDA